MILRCGQYGLLFFAVALRALFFCIRAGGVCLWCCLGPSKRACGLLFPSAKYLTVLLCVHVLASFAMPCC